MIETIEVMAGKTGMTGARMTGARMTGMIGAGMKIGGPAAMTVTTVMRGADEMTGMIAHRA
eukprot:1329493-Amphidinium_carterae.1